MYDGRTNLAQQVASEVREHFPEQTLRTTVPRSVRISEAPSHGQTVMTYDPGSTGALAYLEAARELTQRAENRSDEGTNEDRQRNADLRPPQDPPGQHIPVPRLTTIMSSPAPSVVPACGRRNSDEREAPRLGRGLGALIPTSSEGRRPVDVFFPSPATDEAKHHETAGAAESSVDQQTEEAAGTTSVTTLVADADAGPADLASLTSLSDADLAELDAVAAGDTADSSARPARLVTRRRQTRRRQTRRRRAQFHVKRRRTPARRRGRSRAPQRSPVPLHLWDRPAWRSGQAGPPTTWCPFRRAIRRALDLVHPTQPAAAAHRFRRGRAR